ncbi:2-oxo-4-hydroxy-4-carboxy-5-ureidoimidazoline decarboxylase [Saccharospirillum alexandrii]|uniref:2-oxo-4-hydroxy-4-carboxy-5-ureidoimidazoline decarboxylase n=1 Tax=Saccharospirillum alexandrii TaxID=2448477 RepID=UPI000FD95AA3|nr:2-oxo-4-hydroxy-4-carboxy-5-ureidoimidazoline decarboxylase [Saccharospirillum alexandrii]
MTLDELNNASPQERADFFHSQCAAVRWVERMTQSAPFASKEAVLSAARDHWATMNERDWREAFDGHPMIGNMDSLRAKYQSSRGHSSQEQSGVDGASDETLQALADENQAYLDRHGFIFIVFASGKSADQMLDQLRARINNSTEQELKLAAAQQLKITLLRLDTQLTDA